MDPPLKSSTAALHRVSGLGGVVGIDPPLGNKLQQWQLLERPLQPASTLLLPKTSSVQETSSKVSVNLSYIHSSDTNSFSRHEICCIEIMFLTNIMYDFNIEVTYY